VDVPLTPAEPGSSADRRSAGPAKVSCRVCGHPRDAHEHHRRGSDCSLSGCGCLKWRRPLPRLLAVFAR
jgi:hypothetical protein